jgi:hypothetical protein
MAPHLYFPAVIAIKSTLPFLIFMLLAIGAMVARRFSRWREILFLTIPPAIYLLVAMSSQMNIGVRHILPMYPFLYVLAAGATKTLIGVDRRWICAVAGLLIWQAVSVVRVFPVYMAYGNELWGGPSSVHKYLSDSNVDWAQQLIATKKYLDARGITSCWFVYFAAGVADTNTYGIPCKLLPTTETLYWLIQPLDAPPAIEGVVLISEGDMAAIDYGPGPLNPYEQFKTLKPVAVIQRGIYVFEGHFEIPLASALSHAQKAQSLLDAKNAGAALPEAEQAVALAPDAVVPNTVLGDVLMQLNRPQEARQQYEKAWHQAQTVLPEFQAGWVAGLQEKLAAK